FPRFHHFPRVNTRKAHAVGRGLSCPKRTKLCRRGGTRAGRSDVMDDAIASGTRRLIDGVPRVYYHGYWIKAYEAPEDTLSAKKRLIEALTRRLFNHVEHGINVPGTRLNDARRAYDA